MSQNPPLSIGVVGCGLIAHLHASALIKLPHIRIDAVLARKGATKFQELIASRKQGAAKLCNSVSEMCHQVDAIAILAPPFAQLDVVREIAKARLAGARVRALMIDKPLGRTLAEAEQICALIKDAKLLSAYFENQIYMPSVRKLREHIGVIQKSKGAPLLVRSAEEHAGPHSPWFWRPEQAGGGVLIDMGCHSIAVAWYLLTPVGRELNYLKPVTVQCNTMQLKWNQPQWREDLRTRLGIGAEEQIGEDYTSGIIEFAYPDSGKVVCAQFTNSWMYDRPGLKLSIETLGAGYGFEIDTQRTTLQGFGFNKIEHGISPILCDEGETYGYTDEYQEAYSSFMVNRDAHLDVGFGVEISRLIEACYKSAKSGQKLRLV